MGNKHPSLNVDQGFPNIMSYQKKEVLKSCKHTLLYITYNSQQK